MKPELVSQTFKDVKNQTRRLNGLEEINQNPDKWNYDHQIIHGFVFETKPQSIEYDMIVIKSPYGKKGDILWVRETSCYVMIEHAHDLLQGAKDRNQFVYQTDFHSDWMEYAKEKYGYKWTPAIHMPKHACRLFLEIVDVRPERVQSISHEDSVSEGIEEINIGGHTRNLYYRNYLAEKQYFQRPDYSFRTLWDSINNNPKKQMGWDKNPWVWRIEYKVIDKPDGWK